MDNLKVQRRFRTRKGEIRPLTLHGRIEIFRKKQPELGAALLAAKWLGNEGAHPAEVRRSDLLDAFELVSHVLDEVILKKGERIRKLAVEINKRRGPRSAAR